MERWRTDTKEGNKEKIKENKIRQVYEGGRRRSRTRGLEVCQGIKKKIGEIRRPQTDEEKITRHPQITHINSTKVKKDTRNKHNILHTDK